MQKNKGKQRVLVVRFSALGDVALTLPVLYDVCHENPEVDFVMLTRSHPSRLFINPPANLSIEGVDLDKYRGLAGLQRLWKELQMRYHFTEMIDLHDVLRTRLLGLFATLSGVKVIRFDKGRFEKKRLTRRHRKVLIPLKTTIERYREPFIAGGFKVIEQFKSLLPDIPELSVDGLPEKRDGEYWLAVAPFARHEGKIYPYRLMQEVVETFARRSGVKVFIFGFGKEEESIIEEWRNGEENIFNMAAIRIGLAKELELLAHCDTMLSMDSANMHLASLVGLRTVSVWGATHPYTGFMGYGQKESDAVQLDMTCRPCSVFGNKSCRRGDYHCLGGIAPRLIIERIDSENIESK